MSFSDLGRDPRIQRQIEFLRDKYHIVTAARARPLDEDVEFISLEPWFRSQRNPIRWRIRRAGRMLQCSALMHYCSASVIGKNLGVPGRAIDLIITNDVETIQLASVVGELADARILLDAHEMEPWHRRPSTSPRDPSEVDFYSRFIPRASRMLSVSPSIVEHYKKSYGLECDLVTNAPFYVEQEPTPVVPDTIRLVHHGGTNVTRRLDRMFRLMDLLDDRFTLDLYLVKNIPEVYGQLEAMAETRPNVRLCEPVPTTEISSCLNRYDLGVYMLCPDVQNQKLALPNKLFEFVQARLGIVIWPSPEMARIVQDRGLGVVTDEFTVEAMAKALNSLDAHDIERYKQASHEAAKDLGAESNGQTILRVVSDMLAFDDSAPNDRSDNESV